MDWLQKLTLCLSHKATIILLDELGQDFDSNVIEWRNNLTPFILHKPVEVQYNYVLAIKLCSQISLTFLYTNSLFPHACMYI